MRHRSQKGLISALELERPALRRFLTARTGSEADADDLLSELWIKVTQHASGPVANPRAYLFRMANNLVLDRVREASRRMRREKEWTEEHHGPLPPSVEAAEANPGAEQNLIEQDELRRLLEAITRLPAQAQRVLRMHKLEGLPHHDIAARLGISKSAVEKHIAVAMNHLRRMMDN